MNRTITNFILCLLPFGLFVSAQAQFSTSNSNQQLFIENKGQWPDEVLYLTRLPGINAWITQTGVVYDFFEEKASESQSQREPEISGNHSQRQFNRTGHVVSMKLQGSASSPESKGEEKHSTYYNYFKGNDPSRWASGVAMYREVMVENIYDGIDARYYFNVSKLRYDMIVQPGADPGVIRFSLDGSLETSINSGGELVFNTRFGEVKQAGLYTYQERNGRKTTIESRFTKTGDVIGFEIGSYDNTRPLIIDPVIYATFLGSEFRDEVTSLTLDSDGNVYAAGTTAWQSFPTTPGAYDETHNGGMDIFIAKFKPDLSELIFSTFVGGIATESAGNMAVDKDGNVFLAGNTPSNDFPTTAEAFIKTYVGGFSDVYALKLKSDGTELVYSTYLGGTGDDFGSGVVVDDDGNAYVVGATKSFDYPTNSGAFRTTLTTGGFVLGNDVFVTKLNPAGSAPIYSTYLGGGDADNGSDIFIDANRNVYVTGTTFSNNFPTTDGAFSKELKGNRDAFVSKLNAAGSGLVFSTYLGGSDLEDGFALTVDGSGNVYVTGRTRSEDFPVTAGVVQSTYKGGSTDAFVTKLNSTGSQLIYSTFLAGSNDELGSDIYVKDGYAYVVGETNSSGFPVTSNATFPIFPGNIYNGFLTKLNTVGTVLEYSTFIGASGFETINAFHVVDDENIYLGGVTRSTDFPATAGAFDVTPNGDNDGYVMKFSMVGSSTDVISENIHADGFRVFPNPATDRINVRWNGHQIKTVRVYDITGKLVTETLNTSLGSDALMISTARFPAGIFILAAETVDGTVVREKFSVKR